VIQPPDRVVLKWCSACAYIITAKDCPPTPDCPSCMARGTLARVRYQLATKKVK
jgi:hypothetical protein